MSMNKKIMTIQGFTLVELSIVIIIIGLLIAGVAAGTSLIQQAELNSAVTDFQNYQNAYNNFLGRYNKVPGDFDTADTIWPQCTAANSTNCNGNGNGVIDLGLVINEGVLAWKHLSLANMISSGIQDPGVTADSGILKLGLSIPASKINSAGYMMFIGSDLVAGGTATGLWNDGKTNAVYIAKPSTSLSLFLNNGALKAEDAFNIDKKLDDGVANNGVFSGANTGFVRTFEGIGATANDCLTSSNSAASANYSVTTGTSAACVVALELN